MGEYWINGRLLVAYFTMYFVQRFDWIFCFYTIFHAVSNWAVFFKVLRDSVRMACTLATNFYGTQLCNDFNFRTLSILRE